MTTADYWTNKWSVLQDLDGTDSGDPRVVFGIFITTASISTSISTSWVAGGALSGYAKTGGAACKNNTAHSNILT